jgi:hypothetical protein
MTLDELKRNFPNASASTLRANAANAAPHRVEKAPEHQRDPGDEPVGTDAREAPYEGQRLVFIKSCRKVLCDERNLWDKNLVDALVCAGALIDDSPRHAKIEVTQELVDSPDEERTEVVIVL